MAAGGAVGAVMAFSLTDQPSAHPATLETLHTAGAAAALGDSLGGRAIVRADNLTAGQSVTGDVTIAWSGQTPAAVTLTPTGLTDAPGGGGRLSEALNVTVDDRSTGQQVFDGRLSAMGPLPLDAFAPGAAHDFRFTVTLAADAGNDYQGSASSLRFAWTATAAEPPGSGTSTTPQPPTPTPPAPTPPNPAPPTDTRAPALTLTGAATQRAAKLALAAACDERCTFAVASALSGGKGAKKPRATLTRSGSGATIRLTFDRASLARLKKAAAARLVVTVTAADAAGNRTTAVKRIALKR